MYPNDEDSELLFTYGTLRDEAVQFATFGRRLEGERDRLIGYRLMMTRIDDQNFIASSGTADHRNLQFTGDESDCVEGAVFAVTKSELERADDYEPVDYKRVLVQLQSSANAWVYLKKN